MESILLPPRRWLWPWEWYEQALFDSSGPPPPPPPPPPQLPFWKTVPMAFGIQIHQLFDKPTFDGLKAAGFTHGRRSLIRQGAVYNWVYGFKGGTIPNWGYLDNLFQSATAIGATVLLIFDYEDIGNNVVSKPRMAQFAGEVAARYKQYAPLFEFFNEVNLGNKSYLKQAMSGDYYMSVAGPMLQAVRAAYPGAICITAGCSGATDTYWNTTLIAARAFNSGMFDYFGVHPYGQTPSSLIAAYAAIKSPVPIAATEYGDNLSGAPTMQAFFDLHDQMGCPLFVWYQYKDDGPSNFGIVDASGNQKAAFATAQSVNAKIKP